MTLQDLIDRYGPALGVVAALCLLTVIVPATSEEQPREVSAGVGSEFSTSSPGTSADSGAATSGVSAVGSASGTAGGSAQGPSVDGGGGGGGGAGGTVWGPDHGPGNYPSPTADTHCRDDGRMPDFSFLSPICLPEFDGDNGGATAQGVTDDQVLIVRYSPRMNPASSAALTAVGANDSEEVHERIAQTMTRYYNLHYETYGREVKVVTFPGSGEGDDPETLRADAVEIASELKPFLVYHDSMFLDGSFGEELAARGIVCLCTTSASRGYYAATYPYTISYNPTREQYYDNIAEYIGKRLVGKPAVHAGDSLQVSNDVRRFGLIYEEGAPGNIDPRAKEAAKYFENLFAQYGGRIERAVGYVFDPATQQQQSLNIISQMVAADVNHLICVCDGLYPTFLTPEATRQVYFPEWFIFGNGLDSTLLGRLYDQQQWQHAFGIGNLGVFDDEPSASDPYRAFHHIWDGQDGDEGAGIGAYSRAVHLFMTGVHYAGPKLTAQTFYDGLVLAPPSGGTPKVPTFKITETDPAAINDFVEVWWNASGSGTDEIGNPGRGILMKANGGVRYSPGEYPVQDPYVFGDDPNPVFRLPDEPASLDHDADGHNHYDDQRVCRSCG